MPPNRTLPPGVVGGAGAVTVNVTGTLSGEFVIPVVVDATDIVSVCTPTVCARHETDTVIDDAMLLEVGVKLSHDCPLVADQLSIVTPLDAIASD